MNEEKIIEVLFDIFKDTPRQGPGLAESTQKAISMLPRFGADQKILDIGCGTGASTAELWRHTEASIVAIDLSLSFVSTLRKNADKEAQGDRVTAVVGDMCNLGFAFESFDAIWAEGAIFVVGFEQGLKEWRRFLKYEGTIALTEATWLKDDAPVACQAFWQAEYPAIQSIEQNLTVIEACGYQNIAHFALPKEAWASYYAPLRKRLPKFRDKYQSDNEALAILKQLAEEIDIFDRYAPYYGYMFYLAKKRCFENDADKTKC